MSKKVCCGLALIAVLALGLLTLGPRAQAPREREAQGSAFTGKVIFVESSKTQVAGVFEQPEFRTIGGRSFFVGKAIKNNIIRENFPGAKVWIPLEEVQRIVEFDDMEQLEKRFGGPAK